MIRFAHDCAGPRARRLLAAMLFVLAQTLAWPVPHGGQDQAQAAWLDGVPICHAASDGTDDPSGKMPDCTACLLCHAVSVAAIIPESAGALPAPWRQTASAFQPAFAHTPPTRPVRPAMFPTGPPFLA